MNNIHFAPATSGLRINCALRRCSYYTAMRPVNVSNFCIKNCNGTVQNSGNIEGHLLSCKTSRKLFTAVRGENPRRALGKPAESAVAPPKWMKLRHEPCAAVRRTEARLCYNLGSLRGAIV